MTARLGKSRCQCAACGELFNSTSVFDKHRRGSYVPDRRYCLSQTQMLALGWSRNKDFFWVEKNADQAATTRLRRTIGTEPMPEAA